MPQFQYDNRLRFDSIPIDDLIPRHDCPAWHSQRDWQRLERIIRQLGQPFPVLTDRDGNILSGHLVWRVMRKLGHQSIVVIRPR